MKKLNVTLTTKIGRCIGYEIIDGYAVELVNFDDLDDCRRWASENGYDGILLGAPGMPWLRK